MTALQPTQNALGDPKPKVDICHRTDAVTNPYTSNSVDADSADGDTGNDNGKGDHSEHSGPIATSQAVAQDLKDNDQKWGDIIPPHDNYPGLNWTTEGQAIWNNGCNYVTNDPMGTLTVNKVCTPQTADLFNLLVDGDVEADGAACGGTTGNLGVIAGSHSVSEGPSNVTDKYTVAISCVDASRSPVASGNSTSLSGIQVDENEHVTCTITNTLITGTLHVTKRCGDGVDGPFGVFIDGRDSAQDVACGGSVDITLPPNTYNVSEDPADTTGITVSLDNCGTAGSVTVVGGEITNCQLVNTLTPTTGTLHVTKRCGDGVNGPFGVFINGRDSSQDVACGGSVDITLPPNTYNVSEDPADTDGITVSLDNCGTAGSVTVVVGETTNCLLVNTLTPTTGTLHVTKRCGDGVNGPFGVFLNGRDSGQDVPCGGAVDITLPPNTYNVSEDPADTDGITVSLDNCGNAGAVTVVVGETTNCQLVNTLPPPVTGTLHVNKVCDHGVNGPLRCPLRWARQRTGQSPVVETRSTSP